ncbi:hypothetical protein [Prevotella koreensis]
MSHLLNQLILQMALTFYTIPYYYCLLNKIFLHTTLGIQVVVWRNILFSRQ